VLRGGAFLYEAATASARTAYKPNGDPLGGWEPEYRDWDLGMRCARSP
jgi:hypothetical protein